MMPSVNERMDKRMDNFATLDTSISALPVLPDIQLSTSVERLPGSSREHARSAWLRCAQDSDDGRSGAAFCTRSDARDRRFRVLDLLRRGRLILCVRDPAVMWKLLSYPQGTVSRLRP
jgi:hypothetical protein